MRYRNYVLALACCAACSRSATNDAGDSAAAARPVGANGILATAADTSTPKTLDGTTWRLIEIQSGPDGQSSIRPDNPGRYTISFDSEGGFLTMQIDCNRASANYERASDPDGRGGTLKIAPLKETRAQCPAGSLADRVARDMGFVQQYKLANGQLMLNLGPGGGVYVWERQM